MKREQPLFRGCGTALVTPFYHGQIDYTALGELIDWQIASGVNALIAAGTTGEAPTLDDEEHLAAIACVVQAAEKQVPVIAGGLLRDKADVMAAMCAGAAAVSTSAPSLWDI